MAHYKAVKVENEFHGDNGKYAVGKGKKYFLTTVTETKAEAEKMAHIWNMQAAYEKAYWHYQQGVKEGLLDEFCFQDYLC